MLGKTFWKSSSDILRNTVTTSLQSKLFRSLSMVSGNHQRSVECSICLQQQTFCIPKWSAYFLTRAKRTCSPWPRGPYCHKTSQPRLPNLSCGQVTEKILQRNTGYPATLCRCCPFTPAVMSLQWLWRKRTSVTTPSTLVSFLKGKRLSGTALMIKLIIMLVFFLHGSSWEASIYIYIHVISLFMCELSMCEFCMLSLLFLLKKRFCTVGFTF